MVEVVSGIVQGYEQLALYKDVLDNRMAVEEWSDDLEGPEAIGRQYVTSILKTGSTGSPSPSSFAPPLTRDFLVTTYLDEEMAELIAIKDRAELEHVYGVPPPVSPTISNFLPSSTNLHCTEHSRFHLLSAADRLPPLNTRPNTHPLRLVPLLPHLKYPPTHQPLRTRPIPTKTRHPSHTLINSAGLFRRRVFSCYVGSPMDRTNTPKIGHSYRLVCCPPRCARAVLRWFSELGCPCVNFLLVSLSSSWLRSISSSIVCLSVYLLLWFFLSVCCSL